MRRCAVFLSLFAAAALTAQQNDKLLCEPPVGSKWLLTLTVETLYNQSELFFSYRVKSLERFVVETHVRERIVRGRRVEYQAAITFRDAEVRQEATWHQANRQIWHKVWHYRKGKEVPAEMRWLEEALGEGKICMWRNGEVVGETHSVLWPYLRQILVLPEDGAAAGDSWEHRLDLSSLLVRLVLEARISAESKEDGLLFRQVLKRCELGKPGRSGGMVVSVRLIKGDLRGCWRLRRGQFLPSGGFEVGVVLEGVRRGGFLPAEPVRAELKSRFNLKVERISR